MECVIIDGRYDIKKKIGYGGHGEVYEGVDRESGRKIAAKFEDASQGNLLTEFEAYTLLHGLAGIPAVHHYESFGQHNVMIMELMGDTLGDILDEKGPLPFKQAVSFAKQIQQTVEHIHSNGIVHFDLKLSNIMTGAGNKNETVYIVDFGSAHIYTKVEVENGESFKWSQKLDKCNADGIIMDLLHGTRQDILKDTTKTSTSI